MGEQACLDALIADTLTGFEDDGVTKVGAYGFYNRTSLVSVKMDNCSALNLNAFNGCSNLEVIDILGTGNFNTYGTSTGSIGNCAKLKHLVLRGDSLTTASGKPIIGGPIDLGDGAVYVPQDLVSTYKAHQQWGKYIIFPISAYPAANFETVTDSWSDIIAASANGTYDSKYALGDTKSMVIDGTTYYFQLVAKDADVLASDGTTTVPMTWMMYRKLYATNHQMNPQNSSGAQGTGGNGGWEYSDMRSWLNDTVLPLLPNEVQAGIKQVRKYSDYIVPGQSSITHDQVTADKLWIPSAREVMGGTSYEQTGASYSSFISNGTVKYSQSNSMSNWWLRSAYSTAQFRYITSNGSVSYYSSNNTGQGTCLGFCI